MVVVILGYFKVNVNNDIDYVVRWLLIVIFVYCMIIWVGGGIIF